MSNSIEPISTAPRSKYVTVKIGRGTKKILQKVWVDTYRNDGHETPSYYIPEEDRWCGYTKDAGPDNWSPIPSCAAGVITAKQMEIEENE